MRTIIGLITIIAVVPAILIAVARRERRILREAASVAYDAGDGSCSGGCEGCHCHDDTDEDGVVN